MTGMEPSLLQWECRVSATELRGKSLLHVFNTSQMVSQSATEKTHNHQAKGIEDTDLDPPKIGSLS